MWMAIGAAAGWGKLRLWFTATGLATVAVPVTVEHGTPADQFTNFIDMKLTLIPAGKFHMGSPLTEKDRDNDEVTHEVEIIKPFHMGIHEVTIGQWRTFVKDTRYQTEAEIDGQGGCGFIAATGQFERGKPEFTWKNTSWAQAASHPMVNVT